MKIEISEQGRHVLKEVFEPIILETDTGNEFAICMRDDTVEMKIVGSDKWYRANMETGEIERK